MKSQAGVRGWEEVGEAYTVPTFFTTPPPPPSSQGSERLKAQPGPEGPTPGPGKPRFAAGALAERRAPSLGQTAPRVPGPCGPAGGRAGPAGGRTQTRHVGGGWELQPRTFRKSRGFQPRRVPAPGLQFRVVTRPPGTQKSAQKPGTPFPSPRAGRRRFLPAPRGPGRAASCARRAGCGVRALRSAEPDP